MGKETSIPYGYGKNFFFLYGYGFFFASLFESF